MESFSLEQFSWVGWAILVGYMLVSAAVSWSEGTLTSGSVTMGFLNHGGMWGDLLILPVVTGFIVPHLWRRFDTSLAAAFGLFALSVFVTILIHQQWEAIGKTLGITDHVFPSHAESPWYRNLSSAGYMHVVYMSIVLTFVLAYAVAPVPRSLVLLVSVLLSIHLALGQLQPAWYSTGTIWAARTIVPTTVEVVLVWALGAWKSWHL